MGWFRKSPSSAAVSVLRVELAKAQMRIDELKYRVMELKGENDILNGRILRFCDEVELVPQEDGGYCFVMHSCDVWDALEILRGQR